jgi:hypothetical protein
MQASAVEAEELAPADPIAGFLEKESIPLEHRLIDNRQTESAAPIDPSLGDVEAVTKDGTTNTAPVEDGHGR